QMKGIHPPAVDFGVALAKQDCHLEGRVAGGGIVEGQQCAADHESLPFTGKAAWGSRKIRAKWPRGDFLYAILAFYRAHRSCFPTNFNEPAPGENGMEMEDTQNIPFNAR